MTTTIFMPNFFDRFYLMELQKERIVFSTCEFSFIGCNIKTLELYILHYDYNYVLNEKVELTTDKIRANELKVIQHIFKLYEVYQNEILETINLI